MKIQERMATGWFLTINQGERKRLTASEIRCAHGGCLLAAVVTLEKSLYVLGVTDSTRTELHPTALRAGLPGRGRLTAEAVEALTVGEFLAGFRSSPRGFSMADLAEVDTGHRHGWLDEWERVKGGRAVVRARCRHLEGYIPGDVFDLDKKAVRVAELDKANRIV